jgi:uncharacterized protein (TIGR02996 family)
VTDRLGFLLALLDAASDSLPYSVYADWLDEQGDPLGQLMRDVSARIKSSPDSLERVDLDARISQWVSGNTHSALGPLSQVLGSDFGLLDTDRAWLLFLHADLPMHRGGSISSRDAASRNGEAGRVRFSNHTPNHFPNR